MKTALIFGVTGQDGSYLSESLINNDYRVIGVKRRTSTNNLCNLYNVINDDNFTLVEGELTDPSSVYDLISTHQPIECYNLAAQSHVGTSFKQPSYTFDVNANGPLHILEAIRKYSKNTKYYQASTSEEFGGNSIFKNGVACQDENTPFSPNSPYAAAKLAAHNLVRIYRESYGIYGCCGLLFNHCSPRRGENFVTRKITKWLADFTHWKRTMGDVLFASKLGDDLISAWSVKGPAKKDQILLSVFPKLRLGNLDAFRDFGYAGDYVNAMHLMLQQEGPDDYVVATGETHSIEEFLDAAFKVALGERYISGEWRSKVVIDENLYRPCEVPYLLGDSSKIRELGWAPRVDFPKLVKIMVYADMDKVLRG